MKRKLTILAGTTSVILSLISQPVYAAWGGFGLGGVYTSDPSCTSLASSLAICAGLGTDKALYVTYFNGSAWSGTRLPGVYTSNPSCTSFATSQVICGALGTDGGLYVNWYNGGSWSGFGLGGVYTSNPSCASVGTYQVTGRGTNRVICAGLGIDKALYVNLFDGNSWSGTRLPGVYTSDPSCAPLGASEVICGALGTDKALYVNRFNGSSWSGIRLPGVYTSNPSCASIGANQITGTTVVTTNQAVCAGLGTDKALYVNRFNGNSWSGIRLPGVYISDPSCAPFSENRVACAGLGTDQALYVNLFSGSSWNGLRLPGVYTSNPSCAPLGGIIVTDRVQIVSTDRVVCTGLGVDKALYLNKGP
jgi:hypothetical protein